MVTLAEQVAILKKGKVSPVSPGRKAKKGDAVQACGRAGYASGLATGEYRKDKQRLYGVPIFRSHRPDKPSPIRAQKRKGDGLACVPVPFPLWDEGRSAKFTASGHFLPDESLGLAGGFGYALPAGGEDGWKARTL